MSQLSSCERCNTPLPFGLPTLCSDLSKSMLWYQVSGSKANCPPSEQNQGLSPSSPPQASSDLPHLLFHYSTEEMPDRSKQYLDPSPALKLLSTILEPNPNLYTHHLKKNKHPAPIAPNTHHSFPPVPAPGTSDVLRHRHSLSPVVPYRISFFSLSLRYSANEVNA
jgi:hypothetical protein